jgi:hypothetical protein
MISIKASYLLSILPKSIGASPVYLQTGKIFFKDMAGVDGRG